MARDHLSDTKVRQAKPGPKPFKLADGGGLFLLVHPNGSKYWRLKYRVGGKEKLFAIGVYPEIGLGQARARLSRRASSFATVQTRSWSVGDGAPRQNRIL